MIPLGRVAYEAYCEERHWEAYNGDPLPVWNRVSAEIQAAWEAAAEAVLKAYDVS